MALQSQVISVPFSKGLETKVDPKQVIQGKLLTLENGVFTSPGRIKKRNGYVALSKIIENAGLPTISAGSGLANFKEEMLLLTGTEAYSYSDSTARWSDKQTLTNVQLSSSQIVRNTYNQTTPDVALDSTGLQVVTYQDNRGGSRYCVIDTNTGEQLVSDKLITSTASKPKVFALGNFFVILYIDFGNLNMLPIPAVMPSIPLTPISIVLGIGSNYDAALYSNKLYVGFSKSGNIGILFVNQFLSPSATTTIIGENASSCITVYMDQVNGQMWVAYHNGTQVKYFIYDAALNPILLPTVISTNSNTILNIALYVLSGSGQVFYTQVGSIPSNNFILTANLTNIGVITDNKVLIRSVSIAGKPFTFNNITYITTSFDTTLQPTYFVLRTDDSSVVAKFSPGIGGGTPTTNMVPEAASIEVGFYTLGALQKDLLTTISGVVYTQTGVNAIILDFVNAKASKVELGANTHITSGILNIYDGVSIVEQGFNVFPENITAAIAPGAGGVAPGTYQYSVVYSWMDAQGQTEYSSPSVGLTNVVTATPAPIYFTGTHLGPTTSMIVVGNAAGLTIGQVIIDLTTPSNIPTNTIITGITGNIIAVNNLISTDFTNDELTIANPGLVSFQAVFSSGVNNFVANPATSLYVGMPLSDLSNPSNFLTNTFITNITGSNVTINSLTQGGSFSPPGDVIQASTAGATDFTSVFYTGQTVLTVNNTANLFVGQTLSDLTTPTNFTAGTVITVVNPVNNTITINQPTAGNSAAAPGDTIQTTEGFSVALVIPTLRLTQKKPLIRTPVVIQVYRTASDQTTFFLISSVTVPLLNDTTLDTVTFIDTSNDAAIIGNPILYTTGGVLDNDPAPAFSWITTYQDRIIGLPEENKNQWWYSKQNIPGSPVEFSGFLVNNVDQAGGNLVSALRMDSELIFWKDTLLYYITGVGPDSTGNQNDFSPPQLIASDVGCSDKNSLVLTPAGIFFKSLKGIYLLSRQLQLNYIGAAVESYNQFDVVSANLIENTQQVRFCLSNDQAIVYDYYVQEWSTFTNIPAEDSIIFQGQFTYLTEEGLVLMETPGQFTDNGEFIKLKAVTSWLSFVGLQGFQRVYQMLFLGDYFNPHNVAVYAAYDFNPFTTQQNVVQAGNILGTGVYGSDATYGETSPYGGPPQTYQFRVNLNRQKCQTIQITIEDQQLGASFGENLALSAFAFSVGMKGTANKIVAQGSNTPMA